jgi:hypothetical protein
MEDQGWSADRLVVTDVVEDEPPIGEVAEYGGEIRGQERQSITGEDGGDCRDDDEHEQKCREQAPGAASPEGAQVDPTRPLDLGREDAGDEESGDDEKHVDAEEATRKPSHREVIEEHSGHGQRPQSVEGWELRYLATGTSPGFGSGGVATPGPFEGARGRSFAVGASTHGPISLRRDGESEWTAVVKIAP